MRAARIGAAALAGWLVAAQACAGDLEDFNAAVEEASAHNRVALGYLRTGNLDFAAIELDRLAEAWRGVAARFAPARPAAFKDNALYDATLLDVSTRIVAAHMLLHSGRPEPAESSLQAIRKGLYDMRRASSVRVLADCVFDANAAMDALIRLREAKPGWERPDVAAELSQAGASYLKTLRECDDLAPQAVKGDPEFRRLIDGAAASLASWPKAVETRDGDLLHRLLIELRAFDNLLAFRFG